MLPTLIIKRPFQIDKKATIITNNLYVTGGSVQDITTNKIYLASTRTAVELPYDINIVYYNPTERVYSVYDDNFDYDDHITKLIFKVLKTDNIITEVFFNFADTNIEFDEFVNSFKVKDNILEVVEDFNDSIYETKVVFDSKIKRTRSDLKKLMLSLG